MKNKQSPFEKNIYLVIFDCDGVMFDSARANREYYNSVLGHFDMPPMDEKQFAYAHMHTGHETLAYLFGKGKNLEKALAVAKKMTYFPFIRLMCMEPHLMHLLNWVRPRFKTAISTNRTDTMGAVMAEHGIEGYFDMVVTSMDVARPKPDPEQLFKILDAFSIQSRQAVYIGDSIVDEQAAKDAGVNFISFDNSALSADFHITSLVEVEKILGQPDEQKK